MFPNKHIPEGRILVIWIRNRFARINKTQSPSISNITHCDDNRHHTYILIYIYMYIDPKATSVAFSIFANKSALRWCGQPDAQLFCVDLGNKSFTETYCWDCLDCLNECKCMAYTNTSNWRLSTTTHNSKYSCWSVFVDIQRLLLFVYFALTNICLVMASLTIR